MPTGRLQHRRRSPATTSLFLGALGALLTLATATMYYFGWRRSDVQARAMEMDVTMFGFTTQDYVLRGISSAVRTPARAGRARSSAGSACTSSWSVHSRRLASRGRRRVACSPDCAGRR